MNALKILIVEDQTLTAKDLRETLEEAGHTVTDTARTLEQAIDSARKNPPDLALVDIELENSPADGIATAKALQTLRQMPIIYLTGNAKPKTFQSAKATLPAAYLLKPFRPDELLLNVELAHHFHATQSITGAAAVNQPLYLPVGKGHKKIYPANILYLKADGAYTWIYTSEKEECYQISTNLSQLEQYFPQANFYRLSRSVLVNLDHIERLEQTSLFMDDDKTVIDIPGTNRRELMKKLRIVRTK